MNKQDDYNLNTGLLFAVLIQTTKSESMVLFWLALWVIHFSVNGFKSIKERRKHE